MQASILSFPKNRIVKAKKRVKNQKAVKSQLAILTF